MENTECNAFTAAVSRLGVLSESELRQLHAIVGIRLGIPVVVQGQNGPAPKPAKAKGDTSSGAKSAKGGKASGKGNPSRKSQWANHPLYVEYSRLKKAVEKQAKEQKCSFNSVNTREARDYREAFTRWVEAKSSFRDRSTGQEGGEDEESSQATESSVASSLRGDAPEFKPGSAVAAGPSKQPPPAKPAATGPAPPKGGPPAQAQRQGKAASPPGKGQS